MITQTLTGYPLSLHQQRLWTLSQTQGIQGVKARIALHGELDVERLRRCFAALTARHDSLRSQPCRLPGMGYPILQVVADLPPTWTIEDWRDRTPQAISTAWEDNLSRDTKGKREGHQESPLSLQLLRLGDQDWELWLEFSPWAADPASVVALLQEVRQAYNSKEEAWLKETDVVQFGQVTEWQRQLQGDPQARQGQIFWEKQFLSTSDLQRCAQLTSAPSQPASKVSRLVLDLDGLGLSTLANESDIPCETLVLAAWYGFLWRWTGITALGLGVGGDRRFHPDLEEAIGAFEGLRPLSFCPTPDGSLLDVARACQQQQIAAAPWQDFYDPPSKDSADPIYWAGFEGWQGLNPAIDSSPIHWTLLDLCNGLEPCSLKLTWLASASQATLTYAPDQWSEAAIATLAERFLHFLSVAIAHPHKALTAFSLLLPSEQIQPTQPEPSAARHPFITLPERVAHYARTQPTAIACRCGNLTLSYRDLDEQATEIARRLQALGIGMDSIVGLYLERSPNCLIGLLGILKAGAAYAPLDATFPPEAIAQRLQQVAAQAVITQPSLAATLPAAISDLPQLLVEDVSAVTSGDALPIEWGAIAPRHLAYLIFTSGSTGQPKAVAIDHGNLRAYTESLIEQLALPEGSEYAMASSLATDLGNTALFAALWTGGCCHILPQAALADVGLWKSYFQAHPADYLKIAPTHLSALLQADPTAQILPRRGLILGGEPLSATFLQRLREARPSCALINHYGPTETTVGALVHAIPEGFSEAIVPLGAPLKGVEAYVLDEFLQPVIPGHPGELYLAGETVARGYWGASDLTAERFLPHPFCDRPGARLYRTGDRVRQLPDGTFAFLGRSDHQLKIRGYRIEPGELEATLCQHPAVLQAAIAVSEAESNQPALNAFAVVSDSTVTVADLRQFLRDRLPSYLQPSTLHILPHLPLAPSGKVDLGALQSLKATSNAVATVLPKTETECTIARIWQSLLGVERVGLHDNFFDLGGHSLLLVQVHSQIQTQFQTFFPLADLFQYPTVAALAQFLGQGATSSTASDPGWSRAEARRAAGQRRVARQAAPSAPRPFSASEADRP